MTLTLTLSPNLHQDTGPSLTLTRTDFKIKCPITGQSFRMNELKCVLYLTCCEPLYSVACGWNGLSKFKLTLISIYKVSTGTSRMRIVKVKYRQSATLYGVPFFFFFFQVGYQAYDRHRIWYIWHWLSRHQSWPVMLKTGFWLTNLSIGVWQRNNRDNMTFNYLFCS